MGHAIFSKTQNNHAKDGAASMLGDVRFVTIINNEMMLLASFMLSLNSSAFLTYYITKFNI